MKYGEVFWFGVVVKVWGFMEEWSEFVGVIV